jgi:hypothetical protein
VAGSFTRRSTVTAIRIGPPACPDVVGVELAVAGRVVLGADVCCADPDVCCAEPDVCCAEPDVCCAEPEEQAVPTTTTPQSPYAHRDHIVLHGPRRGGALAATPRR